MIEARLTHLPFKAEHGLDDTWGYVHEIDSSLHDVFHLHQSRRSTNGLVTPPPGRAAVTDGLPHASKDQEECRARELWQQLTGTRPWLPEPLAEPNQESADLASSLTTAFLVLLEQLAPTERAVFLLREVFELDFDEIARSVGKSEANTRQILTRARGRLRESRPRFTVSRRESEEIVRRFRHACVTGNVEALMAVLHADAELVSDGGGKAAAATRPVLGADRITKFMLGYARKVHWSESDFQVVTINGTPGLLMRHPLSGDGTYSFDIADGRIRAIYVVRNPDKLRGFLEHAH